jgi:hypothetical protein
MQQTKKKDKSLSSPNKKENKQKKIPHKVSSPGRREQTIQDSGQQHPLSWMFNI